MDIEKLMVLLRMYWRVNMFNKMNNAKLVSNSRANLNSGNLGRKSVDEVRNEMKKLKTTNPNTFNNSKVNALNSMKRINKNGY